MAFPLEVFSAYYQLRNLTDIFESCCEEKKKEQKLMDLDRGPFVPLYSTVDHPASLDIQNSKGESIS